MLGRAHMTQDHIGIRILFSVQMQRELFVWRGWGWGSRYSPHTWPGGRTRVLNSGCASVPRAGPALTPQSNHSVRQQTWSGDRGAGNSDSRLGLAGPLPPLYLRSMTLEGPHPPGTQACPIRASFPPLQAKSQGKLSPPPFTLDRVSPRGVNVPDREPGARSPPPQLPPDGFHASTLMGLPGGPPPELRILQAREDVYFCICQFARQLSVTESTAQEI